MSTPKQCWYMIKKGSHTYYWSWWATPESLLQVVAEVKKLTIDPGTNLTWIDGLQITQFMVAITQKALFNGASQC